MPSVDIGTLKSSVKKINKDKNCGIFVLITNQFSFCTKLCIKMILNYVMTYIYAKCV